MKKQIILFFCCIATYIQVIAQNSFQSGYFIDNTGKKTECLIKNVDWNNNPRSFKYRLNKNATIQKATIENVSEFGVDNFSLYRRTTTNIEVSKSKFDELGEDRTPKLQEETLFLRLLVDGIAKLYLYEGKDKQSFYLGLREETPTLLIHKIFLSDKKIITHNNRYKEQLWQALKCSAITIHDNKRLAYKKKDFIQYFIQYNKCQNSTYENLDNKMDKNIFSLNLRPGINLTNTNAKYAKAFYGARTASKTVQFRIGLEGELTVPFNRRNWSVFFEPTFFSAIVEQEVKDKLHSVKIKLIDMPIGIRRYFTITPKTKLFLNGAFNMGLYSKVKIKGKEELTIIGKLNSEASLGMGVKYKNKFNFELRYQPERDYLFNFHHPSGRINTFSFIVGTTLF